MRRIKDYVPVLSFVVAVSAVALSQLRPLYEYFDRADITVGLADSISLQHHWGSIILTIYMHARNTGRARGYVRRLEIDMEKIGDPSMRIKRQARTIIVRQPQMPYESGAIEPFRDLAVDAQSDWTKMIEFSDFSEISAPRKQARVKGFYDQLEISRTSNLIPQRFGPAGPEFELPEHLYQEAKSIVAPQLAKLTFGDYRLRVKSWVGASGDATDDGNIRTLCFKFNMTREQISELQPPPYFIRGDYQPFRFHAEVPITAAEC